MRRFVVLFALISTLFAQDAVMNDGIAAFKNGHYKEAVEFFQQAVAADPNGVNPHLYLGTAYMSQWVPGAKSPDNLALARSAETEFQRVLELDANNTTALDSIASLAYNAQKFDEAMEWYKRLAAIDPTNKQAPYSMGVIAWAKWYPALMKARAEAGMKLADPGPLPEPARGKLKAQYSSMIEDGIANLNRALALDPNYADAMAYLNLLIRERGDLRDTREEWTADKAVADEWVRRNLEVKQAQTAAAQPESPIARAQYVEVVNKVDPIYPPLAQQARISGRVRFVVTIAKDGSVEKAQLVSGHPLLVAAATNAVKQYVFKQTLLNGSPVEVITHVDVNFSLGN
jgi:TonB family protein